MENIKQYLDSYLELGLSPIPTTGKAAKYHWKEYKLDVGDFARPGVSISLRTGYIANMGKYFYVVDLDNKNLLSSVYHLVPTDAPIVSTGKGFHIYCLWHSQAKTRHSKGLDIIGNGYVVAPPSIHASGKPYRFLRPLSRLPLALADPQNFTPSLSSIIPTCSTETFHREHIPIGVPVGQRHNTLVSYLGLLFAQHFLEEEALSIITSWNKLNLPPLLQSEVNYTVRNCWESWDTFG